jgi:porphobilinogen deaminase
MRDYLDLAPTPIDEPCAMVEKTGDYLPRMRAECRAFVHQLERTFPEALEAGCSFRVKSNAHEFGSYLEVQVCFNDNDEHMTHWAYMIEAELPELWDDEARAELAAAGYLAVPAGEF